MGEGEGEVALWNKAYCVYIYIYMYPAYDSFAMGTNIW